MLSLLLVIFLLWLFFKLGIGLIKIFGFLIMAGLIFIFLCILINPFSRHHWYRKSHLGIS